MPPKNLLHFACKNPRSITNQIKQFSNQISTKTNKNPVRKVVTVSTVGLTLAGLAYDGLNEFERIGGAARFVRSLKIATLICIDYSYNLHGVTDKMENYEKIINEIHLRSAERLLHGCFANGGLYIKIGQGVSAINHILPKEYTDTLKRLENECLQRKPDEIKTLFLQDFGKLPEEIFLKFNYEPIAAASLAQVFKATTHDGNEVAVKVQYIDLKKRFAGDFGTIYFLLNIVKMINRNFDFTWILNDVRGNLKQELDFVHEGQNAERCANDLAKFKYIFVPKVYWNFTNERVLTAEWADGYKITDIEQIRKDKLNLKEIDRKLFDIFAEQIFNSGFVHADPHPGNVFVRRNKSGQSEIVLLDHGLYETLPELTRISLCKFWEAIVLKDRIGLKKYAKELNVEDSEKLAEILLQRPLDFKGTKFARSLTKEELAYMQKMARERFDIIIDTLKQMPKNMLFVVRNLNTVRAIARNHGDPLDRPKHMARHALACIYRSERGFFKYFRWLGRRIQFELHFLRFNLEFWCIRFYLNFLSTVKLAPPDTAAILDVNYEAAV